MIPVKHIDPDDLPLYAMELLPPEETEELTLHLQHSAEARRVLSEIYSDLSLYAYTAEMHSPPALTRQRLMKHVAREKKAVPIDRFAERFAPQGAFEPRPASLVEEPAPRGAASRVLPWLGWALAAGIAVEAGFLYQGKQQVERLSAAEHAEASQSISSAAYAQTVLDTLKDPAAQNVVLTSGEARQPQGRAAYVADKGALVFVASDLQPLQPYKTYELWLIPADGRDPIPAGTFKPDERGNATVILPQLAKGVQAKSFGVTVEDGDGSPTPTLPILLSGKPA